MATSTYLQNRFAYTRPQAIAWTDEYTLQGDLLLPSGTTEGEDFLILSDHNRGEISFTQQRLDSKKRMVSGHMRSYHIADKLNISWSWDMLPSRAYSGDPQYNTSGLVTNTNLEQYTADGGAGGVDVVNWFENHKGSFYMLLAYDRYDKFTSSQYSKFGQYNQVVNVMFSSFDYNVVKRGGTTHDFWNISVTVEEV